MTQNIFNFAFGETITFLVDIYEFGLSQHNSCSKLSHIGLSKKTFRPLIGYVQQRCSFSFVKRKMRLSDSETLLTAAEDPSATLGR